MLPLRFPWLWMVAGWLLVVGVIYGSVVPSYMLGGNLPFDDAVMHAASYGLLTIWFAGLYARNRHVWVGAFAFLLGVVMELVQSELSYRRFDPEDMVANAIGIFIGLAISALFLAGWCQRLELLLGFKHVGR